MRLRCPETNRWRIYELDAALDVTHVQRLNDLAFAHGTEIVSVCAGHGNVGPPRDFIERAFAEVRFAIFFPTALRLAAQQARICVDRLARACIGPDTVIETFHELDIERRFRIPRERRRGRSLTAVRHARPTIVSPTLAQEWWRHLVERLEKSEI